MKSIVESIRESLLNEAKITPDERVMIDDLSNGDWKKFTKLVVKQLDREFDEDDVLMAMKALAGDGHELCPADFYVTDQRGDKYIAAMLEDGDLMFDPDANEWVEGEAK